MWIRFGAKPNDLAAALPVGSFYAAFRNTGGSEFLAYTYNPTSTAWTVVNNSHARMGADESGLANAWTVDLAEAIRFESGVTIPGRIIVGAINPVAFKGVVLYYIDASAPIMLGAFGNDGTMFCPYGFTANGTSAPPYSPSTIAFKDLAGIICLTMGVTGAYAGPIRQATFLATDPSDEVDFLFTDDVQVYFT